MSVETLAHRPQFDLRTVRVLRYATGAALAMAVAMGIDWQLSYLLPVLSLSFLASPDPCPTLKQGGFLTRDSRAVERKKYGKRKARRSFQFSKR